MDRATKIANESLAQYSQELARSAKLEAVLTPLMELLAPFHRPEDTTPADTLRRVLANIGKPDSL